MQEDSTTAEYKFTEISENMRVNEVGCIKMCAKIETIVNNQS